MNQPQGSATFPNLLIRASAGTGKTFQLSNRYLSLLRHDVPCSQILATTFTRKAAGEIQDRVILRLAEAATDDEKRKELSRYTSGDILQRDGCLALLESAMHQLHRLRISTLDAFFAQIARTFALELGLPPAWQIVDEVVDARLRAQAVEAVLARGDANQLETLVNLLTKGEATRGVSRLIRDAVNAMYDLYLETQPEAWNKVPHSKPLDATQLANALEDLRTLELANKRMGTARDKDYDRAVAGDWDQFLSKGLTAKIAQGDLEYYRKPIPAEAVTVYERLIDHVRAELVGRVAMQTEATYQLLALFDGEYRPLKSRLGSLRFEDVTRRLSDVGDAYDPAGLAFRMDSQIEHLLLDEFQDTSPNQWLVIQPLAERVAAAASPNTSFFCVGDVKQAIYGWRGGVAEIFDAIDRQLEGLEPESLNTSYRSSQPVIDAVNRIFQRMTEHSNPGRAERAMKAWSASFPEHQTARKDLAGYVELAAAPQADETQQQRDVTLAFAAERIDELVRSAPGFEIGVLVRRNQTVAQLIYELRSLGVEASEEGGNPLTDSAAVNVVLSLLRLADHPGDTVARFHVATSPLGPLIGFEDHADTALADALAARVRQQLVESGYGPTVSGWAELLAGSCSPRELSRLEQLVVMASAYGPAATLRTDDFVAHAQEKRVSDPISADVRVMTVHQAKGLQFDIVVLPELEGDLVGQSGTVVIDRQDETGPVQRVCRYANADIQSLMPESLQQMFHRATDRAVTESLCVLYVALTRAVYALHMIIPPSSDRERTLPRNYVGLLRAGLADCRRAEASEVLYQHGDPKWYDHPKGESAPDCAPSDTSPKRKRESAKTRQKPVRVQLATPSDSPNRGWERARPSGLEGGASVPAASVLRGGTSHAFLRGEIIHAWFEQIHWLQEAPPADDVLREVARDLLRRSIGPSIDVEQLLTEFRRMLDSPVVSAALQRTRYGNPGDLGFPQSVADRLQGAELVVQNERGFAFRDGKRMLSGYIDRMVTLHRDGHVLAADIIDFKTDKLAANDPRQLEEKVAFYAPQLEAYRHAVSELAGLDPQCVLAHLLFVGPGVSRRV